MEVKIRALEDRSCSVVGTESEKGEVNLLKEKMSDLESAFEAFTSMVNGQLKTLCINSKYATREELNELRSRLDAIEVCLARQSKDIQRLESDIEQSKKVENLPDRIELDALNFSDSFSTLPPTGDKQSPGVRLSKEDAKNAVSTGEKKSFRIGGSFANVFMSNDHTTTQDSSGICNIETKNMHSWKGMLCNTCDNQYTLIDCSARKIYWKNC